MIVEQKDDVAAKPSKLHWKDLALFGNLPAFNTPLHVGRPNVGDTQRLHQRIDEILHRKWLTNNGPCVQEFEQQIARTLGVKHCIAVCNATVGLEILLRALDLGGEVIVPSLTFVATAHALLWQHINPVFCDIDPQTHNIDPRRIEDLITPATTAIVGVHLWGRPCDVDSLSAIARRHDLRLLFDAAHAFACSYKGEMIGNFGDAEVFSFHATKFVNAFEGGAITTNNDDLAEKVRLCKNFGFAGYDDVVILGTNGKMTEVSAAMGITSLECLDDFVAVNRRNYRQYQEELIGVPGVSLIRYDEAEECNYQYVVLEIDESVTRVGRDDVLKILLAENVIARRYFYPGCHRMEPYRTRFPNAGESLPETERIAAQLLSLPTGTAVGSGEITIICRIIKLALSQGMAAGRQPLVDR